MGLEIFDIRSSEFHSSMVEEIVQQLRPESGAEKRLPTMLLYDERGLQLFEDITYLEEYYLTNAEIEILDRSARRIADRIPTGAQLIELGSGNLRKIKILLQALDDSGKEIDYYALDISLPELDRTLSAIPSGTFSHVRCRGLYGTYDDGLEWLRRSCRSKPSVVLWMGSSLGNLEHPDAATFLSQFASILQPSDALLVAVDGCLEKDQVFSAYNDREGVTQAFYRNGLDHANRVLGYELFKQRDWDVVGEFDEEHWRHNAFISPKQDIKAHGFTFKKGERVRLENSYKFSEAARLSLWSESGLALRASYADKRNQYSLNMLSPKVKSFSLDPAVYAAHRVPSLEDFQNLWKTWDLLSQHMLPHEEILSKPIHLRNCCLFYLGHIPAFFDIRLTRAAGSQPTYPSSYHDTFERGIDPDVDNPDLCHAHSEAPKEWPSVQELLDYQVRVRDRAIELYGNGTAYTNPAVGKAMWLGFEHEAMHIETFLYMLLQSDKTRPPPGVQPDFEALACQARVQSTPNRWISIPQNQVKVGLESDAGFWGWDNEMPVRAVDVPPFQAKSRPLTNGDYAKYLAESGSTTFPKSWTVDPCGDVETANTSPDHLINGYASAVDESYLQGKAVKTVFGPVPLLFALDWPVWGSYDELSSCADWFGGRIPTEEEAKSIYAHSEDLKAKSKKQSNGRDNNLKSSKVSSTEPLHLDLRGSNVSFHQFHPTPVTLQTDELASQSGLGGVWEWTSTVLTKWDGFEPMEEYPAYTNDFFDGKHNVVLGGSWATHSRLAGRKSFVNWYQRNYPYAWAGARMVRDIPN